MSKAHSPPHLSTKAACKCQKGKCAKSCPCADAVPCTVACLYGANPERCVRANQVAFRDESDFDSQSDS